MRRPILRKALLAMWIVFATLALGRVWIVFPDSFMPLPQPVWAALERWFQPGCCEAQAEFEALVILIASFLVMLAATGLGWLVWRRLGQR